MTNYSSSVPIARLLCAAEVRPAYAGAAPSSVDASRDASVEFADVAADLGALDRLYARIIGRLIGGAERLARETGLTPEVWLSQAARVSRVDRRMLLNAADVLGRMPVTMARFCEGWLSWSQIRAIVLSVRRLPAGGLDVVDEAVGVGALTFADAEPEALLDRVENLVAELDHLRAEKSEEKVRRDNFLWLQPFIDGTGGKVYGEFDPVGFGLLDQALDNQMGTPDLVRDDGTDPSVRDANARSISNERGDALLRLCANSLAGEPGQPARPMLYVHTSLATLLGLSNEPAHILTGLTGGKLRLTSSALRELVCNAGADMRLTLIDSGHVVGVGRQHRLARGWLADAIRTLHTECVHPGCRRPARQSDIDHNHEWAHTGPTDEDNLAPLCTKHNNDKNRGKFTLSRADRSGVRRWRHRSGLTAAIHPDTTRLTDGTDPPD